MIIFYIIIAIIVVFLVVTITLIFSKERDYDSLIKNFIVNPKHSTLDMINDKTLALRELAKISQKDIGGSDYRVIRTKMFILLKNGEDIPYNDIPSTLINDIANYAAFFGRHEDVLRLIRVGANNFEEMAKSAASEGHLEIFELMLNSRALDNKSLITIAKYFNKDNILEGYKSNS